MAKVEKVPTAPFNPAYGCTIMFLAILIFSGIVTWSVYSLLTQDKQISQFTQDDPVKLKAAQLPEEQKTQLIQRLTNFGESAKKGEDSSLKLTIAELNALPELAPSNEYGSYTGMLVLEKTNPAQKTLHGRICLPLNTIKFWEGKKRYLVGEGTFLPQVTGEGVDVKIDDVKVPGKEVSEGFVTGLKDWALLSPYRKSEPLASILKGVQKVEVVEDGVILGTRAAQ